MLPDGWPGSQGRTASAFTPVQGARGGMESLAARDGTVHREKETWGKEGNHRGAWLPASQECQRRGMVRRRIV